MRMYCFLCDSVDSAPQDAPVVVGLCQLGICGDRGGEVFHGAFVLAQIGMEVPARQECRRVLFFEMDGLPQGLHGGAVPAGHFQDFVAVRAI